MATRLIGDELDLNLSPLSSGLIIIIVIVVGGGWTLTLDTTTVAISEGMVVEGRGRGLIGIGDVGHRIELELPFEV